MQDGERAQPLWRVIGGGDKGGIIARSGEDVSSELFAERLATGAIIKEIEQRGERLHFLKLCGQGPAEGWVSLRLQTGKDLVQLLPALWRVIGGSKGGILVRASSSVTSEELAERLGTGAIVQEEEMLRERLRYRLLLGHGPVTGWVSISVQQKVLLKRLEGRSREVLELVRDLRDSSFVAAFPLVQDVPLGEAEEIISCLGDLLTDKAEGQADFRMKRKVLRILAFMGASDASAAAVSKAFSNNDHTVRCEAALAMRSMKSCFESEEFKARVLDLFHDPCWRVRCCAARAVADWRPFAENWLAARVPGLIDEESDQDVRSILLRLSSSEQLTPPSHVQDLSTDPETSKKLRILALHGANSNSAVMKFQVRFIKAALPDAEWLFMDAPLVWQSVAGADDPIFREPSELEKTISKGEPFRCWYSHGNSCYNFVDEGVASLLGYIEERLPVHVLLSFSQGSNCISLALDRLRKSGKKAPWALTVMVCGGQIDDPVFNWPAGFVSDQPTLRIYSAARDSFFQGGEGSLRDMYSNLVEFVHQDGHAFPHSEPRAAEIHAHVAQEIRARFQLP